MILWHCYMILWYCNIILWYGDVVPADRTSWAAIKCGRSSTGKRGKHKCSVYLKNTMGDLWNWECKHSWTYKISHWFSRFLALMLNSVCLTVSWVLRVHSFLGKQLSSSRHIIQCIVSVMHAPTRIFTCKVCSVNFEPPTESPWTNAVPAQLWLFLVKMTSSWHNLINKTCPRLPNS